MIHGKIEEDEGGLHKDDREKTKDQIRSSSGDQILALVESCAKARKETYKKQNGTSKDCDSESDSEDNDSDEVNGEKMTEQMGG